MVSKKTSKKQIDLKEDKEVFDDSKQNINEHDQPQDVNFKKKREPTIEKLKLFNYDHRPKVGKDDLIEGKSYKNKN